MNAPLRRTSRHDDSLADIEAELFRPMGPAGLRASTGRYEAVLQALANWIGGQRPAEAEVFRFPPLMSRTQIERSGYLKSFPNLLGCVSCLAGSERDIMGIVDRQRDGASWTDALAPADLVLTPASCYPVYPIAAERGRAPASGWTFEVSCDCFRREPSSDIDRLQSFRMREFVRIGSDEQVNAFRSAWLGKGEEIADTLDLPYTIDTANDPFFGRGAPFLAASQRKQNLKFELLVPILANGKPTACLSFNYHQDHLAQAWGLELADGSSAHTACVAFGMDRLTLALFVHHGLDVALWPASVRKALEL
jgi:seryl-tRNA synthetase